MSSKDDRPKKVPKFGSFKPKASVPEVGAPQTCNEDGDESRDAKKHKSHHRNGERHRHLSHLSHRDRQVEVHVLRAQERKSPEPGTATKQPADELFTLDKRGDPLIRKYRSNDRSQVPAYRRIGRGKFLGTSGFLEILEEGNRELFNIRTTHEGGSAFRDKSLLSQAGKTRSRLFKNYTQQAPSTVDEEFIALEPAKKRKRDVEEDASSASDHGRPSYRSIEGKAKPREDSDSAFESDSDVSDAEGSYITPAKRRSMELSRTVKEHPDNIQAWLELISLQDELLKENEENDHIRTQDEIKALADIKVSMYEKALPHARSTQDRERLLVVLMREGSRLWKPQTLAKRWSEVTEQNPESFALWMSRMDFELSNISTFSYDDLKQRFVDRLRFLEDRLKANAGDERACRDLAEQAIYVFLRLTRFLQETGFVDLAVGAWQAMLELHFSRPTVCEESRESAIASLSEFWDAEVPRIGEAGATGWQKFVEDGNMGDLPEPKPQEPRSAPQTRDLYKAWAATERQGALEARMPAKTLDEGTEDDPYRVVMFADIQPLLVFLPSPLHCYVREQLLDAYLLFCYLPPAFGTAAILRAAVNDPFVYGGSKDLERILHKTSASGDVASEKPRQSPSLKQDGSRISISPDVLFPGSSWFNYLPSWRELYPENEEPVQRSYVLGTVRQLVRSLGIHELGQYHLALEWVNNPSGVKKVAKAVLKHYPSDLGLYNAYALAEWANGDNDTSRKVLQSATAREITSGAVGQALWNTWAWVELESTQLSKALSRICSGSLEGAAVTPALILKTRTELAGQRDSYLSTGNPDHASQYAISLTLLNYLSPADGDTGGKEPRSADQGNIMAAMNTVHAFSAELLSRGFDRSPVHERFFQFAARLVYYHATHGSFRPVYIREQLRTFIEHFPQNTIFLSIFAWAESSLWRIDDPVRKLLRSTDLSESHGCVSSHIFALRYELQVGNVHSIKAAFESAVESEACRGNSHLWTYYIRFCHSRKETRSKTKEVFYRAIAACPGSKRLYMEAFTTLIRDMSSSELKAVFSTMVSKGLRIHVDLDDFTGKWQARQEVVGRQEARR